MYRALVQSRSIVVKQTLAYSLHEVARILNGNEEDNIDQMKGSISASDGRNFEGNKGSGAFNGGVSLVEAELIPIFESMLQVSFFTDTYFSVLRSIGFCVLDWIVFYYIGL